ncbi:MAG: hypothetical protein ACRD1H_19280, partial [Vicinamibacterales bacterium]
HHIVTSRESGGWTPMYPRIASWQPPDGALPVTALDCRQVLEGGAVRVWISVLRGEPHREKEAVETILVKPGERIVVESLRDFGIQPVTFALTALSRTTLHTPQIVNKTAGLEVTDIESVMEPAPKYRISVKNLSTKAAMTFQVQSYRENQLTLSGRQGNPDGRPVIAPGETFSFLWSASSRGGATAEGWAPGSHDVVEIAAVLWDDGTFEGDSTGIASAVLVYLGRRVQLARMIPLLAAAARSTQDPRRTITQLRALLESLTVVPDDQTRAEGRERLSRMRIELGDETINGSIQSALRDVKTRVLSDLGDAPTDPAGFRPWITGITARYEAWLGRYSRH